jgi:hypothetical protein
MINSLEQHVGRISVLRILRYTVLLSEFIRARGEPDSDISDVLARAPATVQTHCSFISKAHRLSLRVHRECHPHQRSPFFAFMIRCRSKQDTRLVCQTLVTLVKLKDQYCIVG